MNFTFLISVLVAYHVGTSLLARNFGHLESSHSRSMLIRSTNKVHGDPSSRQILKRDARTTCNMQAYLAARGEPFDVTKRNNNPDYDECNHTIGEELSRRTMTLPKNDMFKFYQKELAPKNFMPITWGDATRQPFNTALFQEIGRDQARSLGTDGLYGCTVLVIASRIGVYMAHYFEDFSFTEDEYWDEKMKMGLEQRFTNLVIGGLTNGLNPNLRARRPQQVSLTSCAAKISEGAGPDPNDNKIKGYIFHPSGSHDEAITPYATYQDKWRRIKQTVGTIIPPLATPDGEDTSALWTDISCDPLNNNDDAIWDTAAGKVLFKYDPDHNKQKKAALWTEGDPTDRHNDQWTL